MNLPNKLTMFRIFLVPVFLVFLLCNSIPIDIQFRRYIAAAIFIVASTTDMLDGYIARKYNLITNFGKFMDPLADKLLVCSAMIALIDMQDAVVKLPSWVVIIIIGREFMVTGFRTLAVEKKIVIAAGFWGKLKTVFQMIMIIVLLININNDIFIFISLFLIAVSVVLTIISAFDYISKNKSVLTENK